MVLLVAASLLVTTIAIIFVYYRRIKMAGEKYEEAKDVVGDVILSYNKQLGMQEAALEKASYKIEGLDARSEKITHRVETLENRKDVLPSSLTDLATSQERLAKDVGALKLELDSLKKMQENFEKQISAVPEVKVKTAIPIRRERALEPLTETELHVLEFIAAEGEKTAPEIRTLTKLTREHSARLVKKLYEEGYLERDTVKTPYKYRVKDEMLKILRKPEAST
jgi:chromosome segregation ATPase